VRSEIRIRTRSKARWDRWNSHAKRRMTPKVGRIHGRERAPDQELSPGPPVTEGATVRVSRRGLRVRIESLVKTIHRDDDTSSVHSDQVNNPTRDRAPWWLFGLGFLGGAAVLTAVISAALVWRYEHSVSVERRITLADAQPPSRLTGPSDGADQPTVARDVNLRAADFPAGWKSEPFSGDSVDTTGRVSRLAACLGSSIGGTGVLAGEASNGLASVISSPPAVYSSPSFSAMTGAGAPRYVYGSRVVTVGSASTERSDLARYSSDALAPCLTQWISAPPEHFPSAPSFAAFRAPVVPGVQAIAFHVNFQIGGAGSETFQAFQDVVFMGSGRIEASFLDQCGMLLGAPEPPCPSPAAEQLALVRLMHRLAASAA